MTRVRFSAPVDPNDRFAQQIKQLQEQVAELQRQASTSESGEYTPTLSDLNMGTGGSPSNTARYVYSRGVLVVSGRMVYGNTGRTFPSASSRIGLPPGFEAVRHSGANTLDHQVGWSSFRDDSANTGYAGLLWLTTTTQVRPLIADVAGTYPTAQTISSTGPFTWAAADSITWQMVVQAVRA